MKKKKKYDIFNVAKIGCLKVFMFDIFKWFRKKSYYEIKCPYRYIATEKAGDMWWIYTRPFKEIITAYEEEFQEKPHSFFDCGCASGQLLVQAEKMGMRVNGIDIKEYEAIHPNVEVGSILEYSKPIDHDLVYCNDVLTCVSEEEVPAVLDKFKRAKLLVAIHLTSEDDEKAGGSEYREKSKFHRLIKSQNWWLNCFDKNGFNAKFCDKTGFFVAKSRERDG